MLNNAHARLSVVLVHGTFASSRSAWVQPSSALSAALDSAGFEVHRFAWSGRNSHRARARGALGLAALIERLNEQTGQPVHAVVAHSHGGNVAVHAAWRLLSANSRPNTVITLATPFIYARRLPASIAAALGSGLFLIWVGISRIEQQFLRPTSNAGPRYEPLGLVAIALNWALGLMAMLILFGLAYWFLRYGNLLNSHRQSDFLNSIQCPVVESDRLLCIRAANDEAAFSLVTAQIVSWLGGVLTRIFRVRALIWALLITCAALNIASFWIDSAFQFWIYSIRALAYVGFITIFAPAALSLVAYGWDGLGAALFAQVSIESSPPGLHLVMQMNLRDASLAGLAHSSLYENQQVIDAIATRLQN